MPEGHLLHRWAGAQQRLLAGQPVAATSPQGRFAAGAAALDGRALRAVEAYGKHLVYEFDDAPVLHVHLGLAGVFLIADAPPLPEPRGGVRLRLATEAAAVDLIAPARCELVADAAAVVAKLGPDPLRSDASADEAVRRLLAARTPVGTALLDQSMWAGLGNAFRAELLYLMKLHPRTPARSLSAQVARELWQLAVEQMRVGERLGLIATVDGETDARWVYKQEHCRGCGAEVATENLVGRPAYWCPKEQGAA